MKSGFCINPLVRHRLPTKKINIGILSLGSDEPIRVQSMTTVDTMDTEGSIAQSIRMIEAGSELVRITAPSKKEAENLKNIKEGLQKKGYNAPLVADIHFTPNAAEIAARHVEKVRINPGNFADKKKFEEIEYNDESYLEELKRIELKFTPLVLLCKELKTTMRIGTNHGSLSDRILSRYGDTPEGMVESAMEFLRICEKLEFHDIVLSMKASNTIVMVQAYRLLVDQMQQKLKYNYPLHLGVTEAGDGEDGRIKSAVGIGALLEDGLGDTIRVSLTEDPEAEIPVANKLLNKFKTDNSSVFDLSKIEYKSVFNPYTYEKQHAEEVSGVGGHKHPVVVGDLANLNEITPANLYSFGYRYSVPLDKWNITDRAADILYIGSNIIDFALPGTLKIIVDYSVWKEKYQNDSQFFPLITQEYLDKINPEQTAFLNVLAEGNDLNYLKKHSNVVLILSTSYSNKTQLFRYFRMNIAKFNIKNPVILKLNQTNNDSETFQLWTSSDLGATFIDGFGDGLWLTGTVSNQTINDTAFGILQATRTRISKTEYISCPSCGRTLFDLQETTQKIRLRTSHLKGLKIGIMGCIVNGPGEMADADYGYVGTGPGKIHLYKEKIVVKKNVDEIDAVDALIDLIKINGDWVEPEL